MMTNADGMLQSKTGGRAAESERDELYDRLEDARGGMNIGDIEEAVAAIADRQIGIMREALQLIVEDWEFVKTRREIYGDRSESYAITAKLALDSFSVERSPTGLNANKPPHSGG